MTFSLPGRPLTSTHPTVTPLHTPQRNTRPAQSHVITARSGPAAVSPPPASTRATRITKVIPRPKPGASDLNPSSAPAETHKEEDATLGLKTEGFQKRVPEQEENQASLKNEEVKMKPTPEFNDLQPRTGDTEDQEGAAEITGKTPNLKSDSEPEVESNSETEIKEQVAPGSQTKNQNLEAEESSAGRLTASLIPNLESSLRPTVEKGESKSGSNVEERLNVKTSLRSKLDDSEGSSRSSKAQFDPGPKVQDQRPGKTVDAGEMRRREEKKKEVKTGGAKKQSLR